ncbi:MAG: hypothetical protein ACXU8U_09800 [Asticcacaulis sp.]
MSGIPVAALLAIIAFALICVFVGVACLIAAVRQRAAKALMAQPVISPPVRETIADGMGVVIYRLFNRVLISAIGGGLLVILFGKADSRA